MNDNTSMTITNDNKNIERNKIWGGFSCKLLKEMEE